MKPDPALLRIASRLGHGVRVVASAACLSLLVACAAVPPKLPPPLLRDNAPLAGLETAPRTGWPQAQWWRAYGDRQLDDLMARAMQHAPDLALAQARVQAAQQSARLAAAQAGVSINGQAQFTRQRMSSHGLIPSQFLGFNWYNQADLGAQLQYDFDWWGKKRAGIESALDQQHAAEAQASAAALAIQHAVADTYFAWLADQARLRIANQVVTVQNDLARIATLRVRQGVDLADTAHGAQAQLAVAREMQVALQGSARIRHAALAALLGIAPADMPTLQPQPLPQLNASLPADAGLDLLARRPDIAASLWQVEAALRQTDVARAQFYPDLSISAMAGLSSIDMGQLFTSGSRVLGVTPALHLPIFNGDRLQASYGVSRAQLDSAVAQYNATVVGAAREVATQVLSARQTAERTQQHAAQIRADADLLASAEARRRQGVRDARETLAARAQLLQQRDAALQLQAQAVATDLNLIKALGGGYRLDAGTGATQQSAADLPSPSAGTAAHDHR
jgi:multidrug efflux system outer membrane protein